MPLDTLNSDTTASASPLRFQPLLASAAARPLSVRVRMPDGGVLWPQVKAGQPLVAQLRAFGIPLKAAPDATFGPECGIKLRGRSDRTDVAGGYVCSLLMSPDLDGLELEVEADGLIPQTYWIAG